MSNNTASSNNVTVPTAIDLDSIYLDPASVYSFPHFVNPTVDNVPQLPSSRSMPKKPVVKPSLIHTGGDWWLPLGSLGDMYWAASPYGSPPRNSLDINSFPPVEHNTPFDNDTPSLASSSPHSTTSSAPDTSSTAFTLFSIVDNFDVKLDSSPYVGLLVDDIKPAAPPVWQGCIDPAELCAPLREPVDDDDDMSEDDVPLALSLPPPPHPPAPTRKRAHSPDTDDDGDDDAWAPAPKKTKKAQKAAPPKRATSKKARQQARLRPAAPSPIAPIARPASLVAPVTYTRLTRTRATAALPAAAQSSTKKRSYSEATESAGPSTSKRRKTVASVYIEDDEDDSHCDEDNGDEDDGDDYEGDDDCDHDDHTACSSPSSSRAATSSSRGKSKAKPKSSKAKGKSGPKATGPKIVDLTAEPVFICKSDDGLHEWWGCSAADGHNKCLQLFGRSPDALRHIEGAHLGEIRFLCSSCGARFTRTDARVRHWRGRKACVLASRAEQDEMIEAHRKHVTLVAGDTCRLTLLREFNPRDPRSEEEEEE